MFSIDSILGAALIVCGLYMVLWGQNREMKTMPAPSKESSDTATATATASASVVIINNNNSSSISPNCCVAINGDSEISRK
jgi:hypothetical protein